MSHKCHIIPRNYFITFFNLRNYFRFDLLVYPIRACDTGFFISFHKFNMEQEPKKRGRPRKFPLNQEPYLDQKRKREKPENEPFDLEESEIDEIGELKITKDGELLGGREFKIQTFTLPRHPTRHYVFAM